MENLYKVVAVIEDKKGRLQIKRGVVLNHVNDDYSNVSIDGDIHKVHEDRIFIRLPEALQYCENFKSGE